MRLNLTKEELDILRLDYGFLYDKDKGFYIHKVKEKLVNKYQAFGLGGVLSAFFISMGVSIFLDIILILLIMWFLYGARK